MPAPLDHRGDLDPPIHTVLSHLRKAVSHTIRVIPDGKLKGLPPRVRQIRRRRQALRICPDLPSEAESAICCRMAQTDETRGRDWRNFSKNVEVRNLEHSVGWASFSLKTTLTINSGAALIMLMFLGLIVGSNNPDKSYHIAWASSALLLFCWGASSAILSGALAYFCDTQAFHNAPHSWYQLEQLRKRTPPPESSKMKLFDQVCFYGAIAAWFYSFVLFILGTLTAYCGFQEGRPGICWLL